MKTIFCILINSVNFLHKEYYKENYSKFEGYLLNIINYNGIETNLKKDDIENFIFILAKINFLINYKKQDFNIKMEINNLFLKLGLEMIKSQKISLRKIGLELIFEVVEYSLDQDFPFGS